MRLSFSGLFSRRRVLEATPKQIEVAFVTPDGARHVVRAEPDETLMEAAVKNGVPGIEGTCGGAMSCATCHVIVDPKWRRAVGPAGDLEQEVLEFVATGAEGNSRLCCQIRAATPLDGLVLHIPQAS